LACHGSVSIQDKNNKTHQYRVRDKKAILKLINIFNGNINTKHKNTQFEYSIQPYNEIYLENLVCLKPINNICLNNS
jgi:hypothetical protein